MKRIGIVGGTFDPIHFGHLMLGRQAYQEYSLDEVWYMPSRQPPHKQDHLITPSEKRVEMIRLAIQDIPHFRVSEFELKRTDGNTYTADTLRLLKREYTGVEFFFIVGADSIFEIENWFHPEQVLRLAIFLAAGRECGSYEKTLEEQIHYLENKYGAQIEKLHIEELDISSEDIRKRVHFGQSVVKMLPEQVDEYIKQHKLYQKGDGSDA